ncbi:hypothetical protein [Kineococcus rhizosphaerae]|uniref:Protein kinase domain-containing protein n=1 Tax=Kineococcus rhizosphaerae TaxID=559628 RepID=A0A2T0QXP7_9ACTN|nr:hypothetical protein [Kineococcus rhizosphaerae]PRY10816.1 hypothetical protein CLV37_11580 [Kineococcus rhizosphaerae]
MTTEGWPDDRLTSSDVPSLVRHHAGPADDPDRFELLGEADSADEAWHVLDHRAATGEALFTLAALRPAADGLEVLHDDADDAGDDAGAGVPPEVLWRERAAGLARVRHPRLAGVVGTFRGPAPHRPGHVDRTGGEWDYAVLEQAAGRSVADWLRDDPGAGVQDRFAVLATAAGVLTDLHRGSEDAPPLVHGDITPRSVRLGGFWPADGVRLSGASLGGPRRGPVPGRSTAYTAPEVRAGALPTAAGDVFGFGATAVFLLTGTPPATSPEGDVDPALVRRQLAAAALTAPHPGLADLLLQALSPDPAQRPDRLPAWVNGMRAFVEPRPSLDLRGGAGAAADTDFPAIGPVRPARSVRSLPKRPVVVVVGALLLATAGTAVAIAAVQQGRLRDVPNPVAIVQPPDATSAAPTTSAPQPSTAAAPGSGTQGGASSTDGPASTSRAPRPATTAGTPSTAPGTSAGAPTGGAPATSAVPGSAPGQGQSVPVPPVVVPPPVTTPPTVPPTTVAPPPTGPDVVVPGNPRPGISTTPPVVTTPPTTTPPPPVVVPPVVVPPPTTTDPVTPTQTQSTTPPVVTTPPPAPSDSPTGTDPLLPRSR